MPDIQSKLNRLTSSIKKEYESGVDKFQTSQEVAKLKHRVSQNEAKRLELISALGEDCYLKYRKGEMQGGDIEEVCANIMEIDRRIFKDLQTIDDKTRQDSEGIICECGATLTFDIKFCQSCGTSVEDLKEDPTEKTICSNCNEETPIDSRYCNCCGKQL